MKKSKKVPATFIAAVAALALAGCSRNVTEVRRCIDSRGNVLPDSMCSGTGYGSSYGSGYGYGMGSRWVYGGTMSGSSVSGYHSSPTSGASISDSGGHSISRGGFGSHGGGEAAGSAGSHGGGS